MFFMAHGVYLLPLVFTSDQHSREQFYSFDSPKTKILSYTPLKTPSPHFLSTRVTG